MAVEAEDDVFFADLSRQIALLIMDDEEQLPVHMQYPPLPVHQELPYMPHIMMPPTYGYDQVTYTREMSKGTGVFIPLSTTPRRKNRPRNKSSSVKNYNFPRQQLQKSAIMVSDVSNYTRECEGGCLWKILICIPTAGHVLQCQLAAAQKPGLTTLPREQILDSVDHNANTCLIGGTAA
ncbi:hypothetical protein ZIOFF_003375 [Zingiber officinale]|uniref:Uncharacterized protein n=1 Tax=Zingiber officinale TaxID=94328 RepID=A0A8J5MA61_ZINOF|nr:hypothetical protein ZIOFF_003375 [Zingiber officinale]